MALSSPTPFDDHSLQFDDLGNCRMATKGSDQTDGQRDNAELSPVEATAFPLQSEFPIWNSIETPLTTATASS